MQAVWRLVLPVMLLGLPAVQGSPREPERQQVIDPYEKSYQESLCDDDGRVMCAPNRINPDAPLLNAGELPEKPLGALPWRVGHRDGRPLPNLPPVKIALLPDGTLPECVHFSTNMQDAMVDELRFLDADGATIGEPIKIRDAT